MLAAHSDKERGGNAAGSVIKKWIEESGLEVPMSSPEALINFMRAAIEKWLQIAIDKIEMLSRPARRPASWKAAAAGRSGLG